MNAPGVDRRLLKPARDVGITGYGAYIPRFRLPAKEVARVWKGKAARAACRTTRKPSPDSTRT
jgi:hydroxymethylglutaryl-CoA synthase